MTERETELFDDGAIQVRRFFRRGEHNGMLCDDCRKQQHADIVHISAGRRHVSRGGRVGYIEFASVWLCEKCRSHRERRDWVAPVSDERSRLFGTVAESREAASSHPGGVEGRSEGVQTAATSGSGSADTEGRESGENRDHERPGRPCTANAGGQRPGDRRYAEPPCSQSKLGGK